jgi:hypothetical protein
VFGLGGLLVGVALVVWLGSIALDGSGDGGGRGNRGDGRTPSGASISSNEPSVAIEPADGLTDGAEVRVTGAGFPPGSVRLTVCLTHAPAGADVRCDPATTTAADAGPDGGWSSTRTIPRVITVEGVTYDCARAVGACSLRARPIAAPGVPGASTGLLFAVDLPPVDAEAPPGG